MFVHAFADYSTLVGQRLLITMKSGQQFGKPFAVTAAKSPIAAPEHALASAAQPITRLSFPPSPSMMFAAA